MKAAFFATTCLLAVSVIGSSAAPFTEAEVSQVVRRVTLLRPPTYSAPASLGDEVSGSTTIRTGGKSSAELTFLDESLLRLGSNSQFSFLGLERDFLLNQGSAVLKTTTASGGARIRTGAVTAAIKGSMVCVAGPPKGQAGIVKILLFYGKASMLAAGKEYNLKPWQMAFVAVDRRGVPRGPVKIAYFDAELCARTSNLMDPNEEVLRDQLRLIRKDIGQIVTTRPTPDPIPNPFLGDPLPPVPKPPAMMLCPPGFAFDSDFGECFPVFGP